MTKPRAQVLFRLDAGNIWGVSYGHLYRCLALAEELKQGYGLECHFVVNEDEAANGVLAAAGFDFTCIAEPRGPAEELEALNRAHADLGSLLIVDLVDLRDRDFDLYRRLELPVVVLDDLGGLSCQAGALVNSGLIGAYKPYIQGVENVSKTIYCLGPKYCVLGSTFTEIGLRSVSDEIRRVFLGFGGSDPAHLALEIVEFFVSVNRELSIDVVLGPGCRDREPLLTLVEGSRCRITIHQHVPDVAKMLRSVDLAIVAGGRMAFELAATGTPGIVVPSHEHERARAMTLAAAGTCFALKSVEPGARKIELRLALNEIEPKELRRSMSQKGLELIDSRGRSRVAAICLDLIDAARGNE